MDLSKSADASNSAVTNEMPSREEEDSVSIFSTLPTSFSISFVTNFAISRAEAPRMVVLITATGTSTSGAFSFGIATTAAVPIVTKATITRTVNCFRSMKKFQNLCMMISLEFRVQRSELGTDLWSFKTLDSGSRVHYHFLAIFKAAGIFDDFHICRQAIFNFCRRAAQGST